MDEFELIRRFFLRQALRNTIDRGVLLGIGDDGAVLAPAEGRALVTVVDTLVAGVHWPPGLPPRDVGFRALAVNLSDVAAMGGRPRWMTLALTLAAADEAWLAEFAAGLFAAAEPHGVALVGGDTTRGMQTVVSVQLMGDVDPTRVLRRSGASPGNGIYVTGTPGDAAAGLTLLKGRDGESEDKSEDRRYLMSRFARPAARVDLAAAIAPFVSAAIDVSDGLFADARKLLDASAAGGYVDVERVPLSASMRRVFDESQSLRFALRGGDDYELCFTAEERFEPDILKEAARHDVRVTRIGGVAAGSGLACRREGRDIDFSDEGYRHFQ